MFRSKKLIVISLIFFTLLGCFLQGCSEGVDKSPVSALAPNIYPINSSITEIEPINNASIRSDEFLAEDPNFIDTDNSLKSITFKVISAYTGSPLEFATVNVNGQNLGLTDSKGELLVKYLPVGISNIEVTNKEYEDVVGKITLNFDDCGKTIVITMVDNENNGLGSITGKYTDFKSVKGLGNLYVRLYKLDSESDSLVKDFIITTKTSTNIGLEGTFKIINLESGIYQLYIGKTNDIPEIERVKDTDNKKIARLKRDTVGQLVITEPFMVEENKTIYWTN